MNWLSFLSRGGAVGLLTIGSGVAYGLAFPPWSLWPLAWVALVPFLYALAHVSMRCALLLGWVWTMALSLTVIQWFGSGVASYFAQSTPFGLALFLIVPTVTGAIDYMAFAALWAYAYSKTGRAHPLLGGAAWVAAELGRTKLFFGNPWALLPYSQLGAGPLVQIADLTGIYGVSFVVAAFNCALAGVLLASRAASPQPLRAAIRSAAVVALVACAAFGLGAWRHSVGRSSVAASTEGTRVAVAQGNVDLGMQWRREFYGRNLDVYLDLVTQAGHEAPPAVVFWPENAMTFFIETSPEHRGAIARVLTKAGAELVAGGARAPSVDQPPYFNSAFLVRSDGTVAAHYDKRNLLPFAERFPLIDSETLRRRFGRIREFTPGEPTDPLPTSAGRVGMLICNEALFPEPAAERVSAGAEILAILANDGWARDSQYGTTALEMARLRAIEQRRWVVRSSTTGPSAIIDPAGRVVSEVPHQARGVTTAIVVPRGEMTPYARYGDWLAWLCLIAAGAWYALCWAANRKTVESAQEASQDRRWE